MADAEGLVPIDTERARRAAAEFQSKTPAIPTVIEELKPTVTGPRERRCPFFKVLVGEEGEEQEVDNVCDVRIQSFKDNFPYGPTDLAVCRLCVQAKDVQMKDDQWEEQKAIAAAAAEEQAEAEGDLVEEPQEPQRGRRR